MEDLRNIPSVSEVLQACLEQDWAQGYSRERLLVAIREELKEVRNLLRKREAALLPFNEMLEKIRLRTEQSLTKSLRKVINASGVIVHTNLGRAPLAAQAVEHISQIAANYSNLEFDLVKGERGSREEHLEKFLLQLLPAEAFVIVNNNAAALLLVLNSLAEGKEVVVSRGELIEIGGSFRLPEIMKKSGAILKEVGTTNKTRLSDYRNAFTEKTGMVLVVHPSNYRVIGFTEKPKLDELIDLATEASVPLVEDHGSGILLSLETFGIPQEPQVRESLLQGVDLICFSGDKILGGPQAGIICGKQKWIDALHKNPLFRALRVDKMVYAGLEATLRLYLLKQTNEIPVIRMLALTQNDLAERARIWIEELKQKLPDHQWNCALTLNYIGGGVAPMKELPSAAISLFPKDFSAGEVALKLRQHDPAILARLEADHVFFELRTLTSAEQEQITSALCTILGENDRRL